MRAALAVVLAALSSSAAFAQDMATTPDAPVAGHRLSAYALTQVQGYLSDARTVGGAGGGIGVRDTIDGWLLLEADVSYLLLFGNAFSVRVAAGVQRSGLWTPAVLLTASLLAGDRLAFLTPAHPTAIAGPAVTLGLTAAPLRFQANGTQVSVLELGIGVGSDLPGVGFSYQLRALSVGVMF